MYSLLPHKLPDFAKTYKNVWRKVISRRIHFLSKLLPALRVFCSVNQIVKFENAWNIMIQNNQETGAMNVVFFLLAKNIKKETYKFVHCILILFVFIQQ